MGNTTGAGGLTLGVTGQSDNPVGIGVLGFNGPNGLSQFFGQVSGAQRIGVWGDAEKGNSEIFEGIGVVGTSNTGVGVLAENNTGSKFPALIAAGGSAVSGDANDGAPGISAAGGDNGCCDSQGFAGRGGPGITATGGAAGVGGGIFIIPGLGGHFTGGIYIGSTINCTGHCGGDGIFATGGRDTNDQNQGFAADFAGDILVHGAILASTKDFKLDHPLDPANKYLLHASIESSEMMNLYTGNVTTDTQGEAVVPLPEWFEVLNTDFRYQLTVIGQFAQAIIAREISGHQFAIRTNLPNVKVSWQITGVRQDAFAKAHPLVVEEAKSARERGYYLHPELYGAAPEKQLEWARHPELMRQMKERRDRQLLSTAHSSAARKGLSPRP